ncbi:MAG: DUF4150 domain-containing protein [Nannocystaceae bacterium]
MVTVKVNGLSQVHKSSMGVARATIPDVCKTPSPGGPVPIPYPNIAMSTSLKKGTKKVKTDGKMAAIKGSEYSRSNGDEAGTAGGIKSGVNMKEAKFILYSPDVKYEGKNACRRTDKMTMNHENTMCLGGTGNMPVVVGPFSVNVNCEQKREKKDWDDCDVEQLCAKIAALNDKAKQGELQKVPGASKKPDYSSTKREFMKDFADTVNAGGSEDSIKSTFISDCAYERWKNGDPENGLPPRSPNPQGKKNPKFQADHTIDAALGGSLSSKDNLKWMTANVNSVMGGSTMRDYDPAKNGGPDGGVTAPGCCD